MQTILDTSELKSPGPIVNVASVRHLSPFRYPGGKTWLVPKVISILKSLSRPPAVLVDPFLGGGSVPLAALLENCVERLVLSELDPGVASVWKVIFSDDYRSLCSMILEFRINRENVLSALAQKPVGPVATAFQTIVRNRTFRGGILAQGASLVKVGENGRGVASRWYPETLVRRIELLQSHRDRVTFIEGDGIKLLRQFSSDPDAFIFLDPPYTVGNGKRAGSRLYDHSDVDHEMLFSTMEHGQAQFLMTYDDALDVLTLAKRNGFVLQHVAMKSTHHRCMHELLISRA